MIIAMDEMEVVSRNGKDFVLVGEARVFGYGETVEEAFADVQERWELPEGVTQGSFCYHDPLGSPPDRFIEDLTKPDGTGWLEYPTSRAMRLFSGKSVCLEASKPG